MKKVSSDGGIQPEKTCCTCNGISLSAENIDKSQVVKSVCPLPKIVKRKNEGIIPALL